MPHETDQYQKNAKIFDSINSLYQEYTSTFCDEKNAIARAGLREKLIIQVSRIFYLDEIENQKDEKFVNISQKRNSDYSFEIIQKIDECLKTFPKSEASAAGGKISKYLYNSIDRMLATLKENDTYKEQNGNVRISDNDLRKAKKIKKLDAYYEKLGFKNQNIRNIKIADSMGITSSQLEFYQKILSGNVQSLDEAVCDKDGEETNKLDYLASGKMPEPDTVLLQKSAWEAYLSLVQEVWVEKDCDPLLSTLVTISLLDSSFPQRWEVHASDDSSDASGVKQARKSNSIEDVVFDPRPIFEKFSFFDKSILTPFFSDENYILPQFQKIMEAEGKAKSTASKKVSRFYDSVVEKVKKRKIENCLFPEKTLQRLVNFLSD